MHIAVSTDTTYLRHTAVMLTSLLENNKGIQAEIHLIGVDLDSIELERFRNTIALYHQTLHYYPMSASSLEGLPKGTHSYITSATWCRLFLQDILPAYVDKVLYLDGDIIVTGDIKHMYDTPLGDNLIAAVSDEVNGYAEYYQNLGLPQDHTYVNAGVLLINLDAWRRKDIKKSALEYLSSAKTAVLPNADQDIINILCAGSILLLPLRYNLQDALMRRKVPYIRPEVEAQIDREVADGRIFHFSCVKKPWQFRCIHPLRREYYRYLEKTEWKYVHDTIAELDILYMIGYWCAYMLRLTNRYRKSVSAFAKSIDID